MAQITITLPDGSSRELPEGATGTDLARSIGRRLAQAAVIVNVDGVERDLGDPLPDGATVAVVTAESDRGLYTIRHSTAHVMAQAVLDLWPGATFGIGPPVEDGFYYDFELPEGGTFSADDLPRIEARMREIIAEGQPFVRRECPVAEGLAIFRDHRYKREIIEGTVDDPTSVTESGVVRLYENPPRFVDLCRGPHVPDDRHLPRPLQADAGGRRLLAGPGRRADAAAHLRHRLGVGQGAPGPPAHVGGGGEA